MNYASPTTGAVEEVASQRSKATSCAVSRPGRGRPLKLFVALLLFVGLLGLSAVKSRRICRGQSRRWSQARYQSMWAQRLPQQRFRRSYGQLSGSCCGTALLLLFGSAVESNPAFTLPTEWRRSLRREAGTARRPLSERSVCCDADRLATREVAVAAEAGSPPAAGS